MIHMAFIALGNLCRGVAPKFRFNFRYGRIMKKNAFHITWLTILHAVESAVHRHNVAAIAPLVAYKFTIVESSNSII